MKAEVQKFHDFLNDLTGCLFDWQTFGVDVLGMDLSSNMVEIAMERAVTEKLPSVCDPLFA